MLSFKGKGSLCQAALHLVWLSVEVETRNGVLAAPVILGEHPDARLCPALPARADGHLYQELASIQEKLCNLALIPCSSLGTPETELHLFTVPGKAG